MVLKPKDLLSVVLHLSLKLLTLPDLRRRVFLIHSTKKPDSLKDFRNHKTQMNENGKG